MACRLPSKKLFLQKPLNEVVQLTRVTYSKEEIVKQSGKAAQLSADDQILHLKRLLVTLKQQYEKNLHGINEQLQNEIAQKQTFQRDFERLKVEVQETKTHHAEELQALQKQQIALKDLLKKGQPAGTQSDAAQQRIEQLERVIPYLRERTEEANLETEHLREELEQTYNKIKILQTELIGYQNRDKDLQNPLTQSSEKSLPDTLEARYAQAVNERLTFEQEIKQLQQQIENQSANLLAFQGQLDELNVQKKQVEATLQNKENTLSEQGEKLSQLSIKLEQFDAVVEEKYHLHEKYEQLREEFVQVSNQLEEATEVRLAAESQLEELTLQSKDRTDRLFELETQYNLVEQAKASLQQEAQQLHSLLDESEMRLKVAQQHLAKKVKEVTLLAEKVESQHANIGELQQQMEMAYSQIQHLQANVELYQAQEKKLQEQLHEALKSTEGQVAKWEEKYFKMYDKWQESETRIRELKKFEEKHQQVQSLLANLSSFMGASFTSSPLFQAAQETIGKRPPHLEGQEELSPRVDLDAHYDLFEIKNPPNDPFNI
jgi:chromosome segregation ATPase